MHPRSTYWHSGHPPSRCTNAKTHPIYQLPSFAGWLGIIVGTASLSAGNYHAVLWKDGKLLDLNTLAGVTESGWVLQEANGINDHGILVGYGLLNGVARGFQLDVSSVVPEPNIFIMFAVGIGFAAIRRSRHRKS